MARVLKAVFPLAVFALFALAAAADSIWPW